MSPRSHRSRQSIEDTHGRRAVHGARTHGGLIPALQNRMQEEQSIPGLAGRAVCDPEDCAVGIVADEQSAISRDRNAGRPAPNRAFVQHEPGYSFPHPIRGLGFYSLL